MDNWRKAGRLSEVLQETKNGVLQLKVGAVG